MAFEKKNVRDQYVCLICLLLLQALANRCNLLDRGLLGKGRTINALAGGHVLSHGTLAWLFAANLSLTHAFATVALLLTWHEVCVGVAFRTYIFFLGKRNQVTDFTLGVPMSR